MSLDAYGLSASFAVKKILDILRLLIVDLSSAREKGELSIGRVPDTGTLVCQEDFQNG